jgi:hypothetical protein
MNARNAVIVFAVGLVTSVSLWWGWGSVHPAASIDDEASYVMQAKIFASGRWSLAPPVPPRFVQPLQGFSQPRIYSKYPPGHALFLVPGVLLGQTAFMPVALYGVAAASFVLLAGREEGWAAAILAWLFWIVSPGMRVFGTTYLSEASTTGLWALGWIGLSRWKISHSKLSLAGVAAAGAWGVLTRPLTMAVFVVFVGTAVVWDVAQRRRWRELWLPLSVGAGLLVVAPLWSYRSSGRVWPTPYSEYSRIFLPSEKLGFGLDAAPAKETPIGVTEVAPAIREMHLRHTVRALPRIALERLDVVRTDVFGSRWLLIPLIAVGLALGGATLRFAVASSIGLFLAYLWLGHFARWSPYYVESYFPMCAAASSGLRQVFESMARRVSWPVRSSWPIAATALGAATLLATWPDLQETRLARRRATAEPQALRETLRRIPGRTMVFVPCRYDRLSVCALITTEPPFGDAKTWYLNDLGSGDLDVARAHPDRLAFVYDFSGRLTRIAPVSR